MGKRSSDKDSRDIAVQTGGKNKNDDDKDGKRHVTNIATPGAVVGIQCSGDVHGSTVHISRGGR